MQTYLATFDTGPVAKEKREPQTPAYFSELAFSVF